MCNDTDDLNFPPSDNFSAVIVLLRTFLCDLTRAAGVFIVGLLGRQDLKGLTLASYLFNIMNPTGYFLGTPKLREKSYRTLLLPLSM